MGYEFSAYVTRMNAGGRAGRHLAGGAHGTLTAGLAGQDGLGLPGGLDIGAAAAPANAPPPPPSSPDTWLYGDSGYWTGGYWSAGVPTASSDVTITAGGVYTIEINSPAAAHSVLLNDGGGVELYVYDNTLTVGTTFNLTGGTLSLYDGTLAGGTLIATSYASLEGSNGTLSGVTV